MSLELRASPESELEHRPLRTWEGKITSASANYFICLIIIFSRGDFSSLSKTIFQQLICVNMSLEDSTPAEYVTLVSSDGFEFVLPRSTACVSGTIRRMLDPASMSLALEELDVFSLTTSFSALR